ncbi:hypothetical protein Trydic_g3953 [Trypoxylus dichotomus]
MRNFRRRDPPGTIRDKVNFRRSGLPRRGEGKRERARNKRAICGPTDRLPESVPERYVDLGTYRAASQIVILHDGVRT